MSDIAADLGNNGGATASFSGVFMVNAGDTILMVVAMGDAVPATGAGSGVDDTSVTDNGVAMTLAGKILNETDCWEYVFYSLNPAAGSHAIVAHAGSAHWLKLGAASYTGVTGVGASTAHSGAGRSLTTSLTTQANSWVFLAEDSYSGGATGTAGAGDYRRSYEGTYGTWGIFDSNAAMSAGTHSFTTNRPQSVVITHIAVELLAASGQRHNHNQHHHHGRTPPPPPAPSSSLPPPAVTGRVLHIAATAGDQTSIAQRVINSAASGDTVFWDEGNHSICGTLSLKSGVLFVGPSATFPLLGQNSRAVIDGCGETGSFDNTSGASVYGLSLTSFGTWDLTGVSNLTITNLFWDQGNINSSHHTFCYTNASNVTIQWSTFQNFEGIGNLCTSGGMSNFIFTHNVLKNCRGDCIGVSDFNSSNEQYTFNYFTYDPQYTNCGATNCIGRIQMELQWDNNAYAGQPGRHGLKVNDNFFEGLSLLGFNDAPNTCCNFSLSVVDGGFDEEISNNYLGGSDASIEWDAGPEWCKGSGTTCGVNLHDNYNDSVNTAGFVCGAVDPASGTAATACGNFGPYETSVASVVSNNNYLPSMAGSGCPNTGATMPCDSVQYPISDTHVNRGRLAVPASGSAP